MEDEDLALKFELRRPSILATSLWGLGLATWTLTIYAIITWHSWIANVENRLIVLVSFVCGLNAMAAGFLIDMHSLEYKGVVVNLKRRQREKKNVNN